MPTSFPFVDHGELTAALAQALQLNLQFRRLGVLEALEAKESSRFLGARKAREAFALDPDLASVARFVALLLAEQERFASAARFMEAAANLYGPRSAEGREARRSRRGVLAPGPRDVRRGARALTQAPASCVASLYRLPRRRPATARPSTPEANSIRVPGSGTKRSVRTPVSGTSGNAPVRLVKTLLTVTSCTTPEGCAVLEVSEAGPWAKPPGSVGVEIVLFGVWIVITGWPMVHGAF